MPGKDKYTRYVKFVIYLIIIILLNLAGTTLFFRIDLTDNQMYSISEASKKVVATLSEPLTINVFFTKNLPAPHNNTERYLHDLLEEYALHATRFFNYRFYNVSPDTDGAGTSTSENQKLARNYGIQPIQIQAVEQDEVKFKKAYMGLVLIHGDMVERIPTIASIEGLEYRLTSAIQKLNNKVSAFLSLSQKIRIELFLSSSLKQVAPVIGLNTLQAYPEKLKQIIAKLNETTYDKLEYHYLDPTTDKDAQAKVSRYNIMTLGWPALSDGKVPAGKGVIGLTMAYGDKVQEIRLLNVIRIPILGTQYNLVDPERLEELLQDNLEALIDINEDLGYLADHGTLPVGRSPLGQQNPEALSSFAMLLSRNYTLKPLHLKQNSIPASLNCLVIAHPTEKFTDYQLYQIDQALMHGTNLALFVDAFNEITPGQGQAAGFNRGPVYVPIDTGLEKLLEHYGIRIKKSFVLDQNSHMQMLSQAMGGGQRKIYFAPIIKNTNINHDLEFMKNIKGLITFKMSPLEIDASRIAENKLKAIKLIASSKKSWEMRENINLNPLLMGPPPPEAEQQSFPLAYLIKGKFPSFFAGKPIPVKVVEDKDPKDKDTPPKTSKPADLKASRDLSEVTGEGAFLSKGKPAQILVVGSSEILKDRILDPEGRSPNAMFVMNVMDALNGHEDMAVMRSKIQRFNPLLETSAAVKTFIKAFNIAGLPIFVVFFGLFVWLRRHSRKKQIQMMFQE